MVLDIQMLVEEVATAQDMAQDTAQDTAQDMAQDTVTIMEEDMAIIMDKITGYGEPVD